MTKTTTKARQRALPGLSKPVPKRKPANRADRILYFAYGANTNLASMDSRCPDADPVGKMMLEDHCLKFRGVADVVRAPGRTVFGALWWITPRCERSLDAFEGFPSFYTKQYGKVVLDGVERIVMFYVMAKDGPASPPYSGYERTLREGYEEFGLPQEQIDLAIEECPAPVHRFKNPADLWSMA
jgi:hypothetical protein